MKLKNKKIVVTGGAGFIGSNLVSRLPLGNKVVVVDNFSSGSLKKLRFFCKNRRIKTINGDFRDEKQMTRLLRGADIVYHLGAVSPRTIFSDPVYAHDVNVTGTLNILRSALNGNVKRFVYISSSYVYGNARRLPVSETHPLEPMNLYGAFKVASEKYVKSFHYMYGLPIIIVRPFNTYGPGGNFLGASAEIIPTFLVRALFDMPLHVFGDGTQGRDFTYVSDTISGIIRASTCDSLIGEEVNIARGEAVSINNVIKIIERILKRDVTVRYQKSLLGDMHKIQADISKARKHFKFNPKISIEAGLKRHLAWFKKQSINPYDIT